MSEDRVHRPQRRFYLDWWDQQRILFWNPYVKHINDLLYSYGNLLQAIKPEVVDLDLARLYALSHGHVEHSQEPNDEFDWSPYKKVFANNIVDIRHWVYNAIHTSLTNFRLMFDPDRTAKIKNIDGDASWQLFQKLYQYGNSSDHYVGPTNNALHLLDLGYTTDFSEFTKQKLLEIVEWIESGKLQLEDPTVVQKLHQDLEAIKIGMIQDHKRFEINHLDEVYGNPSSVPRAPTNQKLPVSTFSAPLSSLLPKQADNLPDDPAEWLKYMRHQYCQCRLPLYGLIFQILSGLRTLKVDGTITDESPRLWLGTNSWRRESDITLEDMVAHRAEEESEYRWIQSLPSYRPEFIITLHDYTRFDYWMKRNQVVSEFDPGYLYLLDVLHVYTPNCAIDAEAMKATESS